jgi:hypothetical protein
MQSYKAYLYGQVIPHYVSNPNLEIYPIVSVYENLHTTGALALTPDPHTLTLVNGTRYSATAVVGQRADKYYAYVPPGWTVVGYTSKKTVSYTGSGYVTLDEGFTEFSFHRADWDSFRLDICLGKVDFTWDEGVFSHLLPHQDGCDRLVNKYCETAPVGDPVCNCIRELVKLREEHPFESTDVTCLGRECGKSGYRTKRMMKERCSVKYCKDFVTSKGENNVVSGTTTIECGGDEWDVDTGQPKNPAILPPEIAPVSTYVWAILAVSVLVWCVLLYVIVRFTRKRA